jgi:SNF2 family DNA or RNA helicase
MEFKPHDYQQYAIDFIKSHEVAAVFLDMGLGKTVITLTALRDLMHDEFEIGKVLVIAPLRVARDTWPAETEKWDHLKDLRLSVITGTAKERMEAMKREADIHIVNRENVQWLIRQGYFPWDTVVIDELSSFKNSGAKRFKALMLRRQSIKRIIGLTGTPAVNGLEDLWAEYRLLDDGQRLGRNIGDFRNKYLIPDKRSGYIIYTYKPKKGASEEVERLISDITISMKSVDHLKMPELISTEYPVKMDDEEQDAYKALKKEYVSLIEGNEVTAANAASLSGKLLQLANGAVYDDEHAVRVLHDRKLDALEDIIESMQGKPLLVAYWYKHDLQRIEERLTDLKVKYSRLDTPKSIREWNERKLRVGLIHPASAGHGLNLQAGGSHLVWYGLTWSLELYQQTNARLWRQGQSEETVVIQHIVTEGTIDRRVLNALEQKRVGQDEIIDAVKAEIGFSGRMA